MALPVNFPDEDGTILKPASAILIEIFRLWRAIFSDQRCSSCCAAAATPLIAKNRAP
jgi:hypothetical protein